MITVVTVTDAGYFLVPTVVMVLASNTSILVCLSLGQLSVIIVGKTSPVNTVISYEDKSLLIDK